MDSQKTHLFFVVLYLVIAVVTFFIHMQIATLVFGVLCLNSLRLYFRDKDESKWMLLFLKNYCPLLTMRDFSYIKFKGGLKKTNTVNSKRFWVKSISFLLLV